MSDIVKKIKDLSHKVSEDYLLINKDMNESLGELVEDDEIENTEILKRICEQCNQNVYLALFLNPETDNSNITFDIADFDKVSKNVKESEEAMKDYNAPPKDFRSSLELVITPKDNSDYKSEGEKLSELNEVVEYRQSLKNLLNRVGIMKTAEEKSAEECFNEMAYDAKILVSRGESMGDISKIATRHVKENIEGDSIKIAACYDMIHKELKKSNFSVKTGFTKLSSQKINENSKFLEPVKIFSMSMAKLSGLNEMEENLKKMISTFDNSVNENKK